MEQLLQFRREKDAVFADDPHSPIPLEDRGAFGGLSYFEPNPALALTLPLLKAADGAIQVQTSDGQVRAYRRAAAVEFEVEGAAARLTLFDTGHHGLFLPFRDATSGKQTYGAGRYLDLHPNDDETIDIDFNYAYNPSCAFDEAYSCPLPPPENWLAVPIEAGEKDYPPPARAAAEV